MSVEVDFVVEPDAAFPLDEAQVERVCECVLTEEDVTRMCYVSVTVVGEERIRELNRDWRGIDRATDVVSLECERPDDPDLAEGEPCELGDIVLAPTYIERQAREFGNTFDAEFTLLLVHGLLHLLGYDHVVDDEAEEMERREDELVSLILGGAALGHVTLTRHRGDDAL